MVPLFSTAAKKTSPMDTVSQRGISQSSAYSLVHCNHKLHKVSGNLVPEQLTEGHTRNRRTISSCCLERRICIEGLL